MSVTLSTGLVTRLSNQVTRTDDVPRRRDVDARFPADQALGRELLVRPRRDRADRELAVQLGQRRRAEAGVDGAPDADAIATRGRAPPTCGLTTVSFALGNRRAVVGRRHARSATVVSRLWPL